MSRKPKPTPEEFRRMGLALIVNEEAQKLVATWPYLDQKMPTAARRRHWAKLAAVRSHAPRIFEEGLVRAGILRRDGSVDPEVERIVAGLALTRLMKAQKR